MRKEMLLSHFCCHTPILPRNISMFVRRLARSIFVHFFISESVVPEKSLGFFFGVTIGPVITETLSRNCLSSLITVLNHMPFSFKIFFFQN